MGPIAGHLVLHSIGLVVVFLLLVLVRLAARRDPLLVHAAQRGALLAVLVLPPLQLALHGRAPGGATPVHAIGALVSTTPDPVPAARPDADAPRAADPAPAHAPRLVPLASPARAPAPVAAVAAAPPTEPALPFPTSPAGPSIEPAGPSIERIVALAWLAGALVVLAVHLARLRRTRRLLAAAWPVEDAARLDAWRRASAGSRLAGPVRLLESRAVAAPAGWGVLRPTIVLPMESPRYRAGASLEWALLHELIHLERNDPRDVLGQRIVTALFWFHPVAWWLSRALDRSRELACDHLVVERGGRRRSYALALLDSAAPDDARPDAVAPPAVEKAAGHLLAWSPSPSQLRRRIEMLTRRHAPLSPRRRLVYGLGAGALLSACWAGQLAIASTFDAGDERLVAFCDPKKKSKKAPRFTEPRPPSTPRRSDADVVHEPPPAPATTPIRLDERSRSWVVPRSSLDQEVRDSLVRTLLHDESPEIRAAAAQTLSAHLGDESVKNAFLRAMGNGCDKTRARLMDDLLSREPISDDMRDLLTRMFGEPSRSRGTPADALRAAGDPADARLALIHAVQDHRDSVVQLSAAEALSSHVDETQVRQALLAALKKGRHEVARMAMIRALEPHVAEPDVRDMFQYLIPRDDNPVAVQAMAEALALRADDAGVRATMIDILLGERNDLVKVRFAEALARHVHQPEVKRAFIEILPKLGNEVIRMRMVTALASLVEPGAGPSPKADRRTNTLPLPEPADGTIVPVMKRG